jgi:hypothetical protein
VEDGRWRMEGGGWRVEDGEWRVEDGRWRMEVESAAPESAELGVC